MCIQVTRHYACRNRDGTAVATPHTGTWIQPCSTPLHVISGILSGAATQPCLAALDERDEHFSYRCPECTGRPATLDRRPDRVVERPFDFTASRAANEAYARCLEAYASKLAGLYWAWISDNWPVGGGGPPDPDELAERAVVAETELMCREDSAHGPRSPGGVFCECELTATPLLNNFASQRRFDLAYQCLVAQSMEAGESPGGWPAEVVRAAGALRDRYASLGAWMRSRSPPVLRLAQPYGQPEMRMRARVVEDIMREWRMRADVTPDGASLPRGTPWDCMVTVVADMGCTVILDSGLTLERATTIVLLLLRAMFDRVPNESRSVVASPREPDVPTRMPWRDRLADLLTDNSWEYCHRYGYGMSYVLNAHVSAHLDDMALWDRWSGWGDWNTPTTTIRRFDEMLSEWSSYFVRSVGRLGTAENGIALLRHTGVPPGARCYICSGDFVSNEAPFDHPAVPLRCTGAHTETAGHRCLVGWAAQSKKPPACPLCRKPFHRRDDPEPGPQQQGQ